MTFGLGTAVLLKVLKSNSAPQVRIATVVIITVKSNRFPAIAR